MPAILRLFSEEGKQILSILYAVNTPPQLALPTSF